MIRLIHSVTFYRYGLLSLLADGQTYSSKELDWLYRATTKLSPRKYSPHAATRRLEDAGLAERRWLRGLMGQRTICWRITPAGRRMLKQLQGSFDVATVRKHTKIKSA